MAEWQDEEVSKLISLYEQRPCLHDVLLSDYHKTKKRQAEEEVHGSYGQGKSGKVRENY